MYEKRLHQRHSDGIVTNDDVCNDTDTTILTAELSPFHPNAKLLLAEIYDEELGKFNEINRLHSRGYMDNHSAGFYINGIHIRMSEIQKTIHKLWLKVKEYACTVGIQFICLLVSLFTFIVSLRVRWELIVENSLDRAKVQL